MIDENEFCAIPSKWESLAPVLTKNTDFCGPYFDQSSLSKGANEPLSFFLLFVLFYSKFQHQHSAQCPSINRWRRRARM